MRNASALGSGLVTNNSELELALSGNGTIANRLAGTGAVYKTGPARVGLTAAGSSMGSLTLSGGVLELSGQAGLTVSGAFSQSAGAGLAVTVGSEPAVSAGSANLAGSLEVMGLNLTIPGSAQAVANQRYTVISSAANIVGGFDSITFDNPVAPPDYLTVGGQISDDQKAYTVGLGLAWLAPAAEGHGTFTLADAGDSFEVDLALGDRSGTFSSGWNGRDLTKLGQGNLILSRANSYTGRTDIQAGTLTTGIANAFADSSQVSVAAGATLNLNNYSQTAKNLSGAGTINLGSARLTADNSTASAFNGLITGAGGLTKTGIGNLTLTGSNNYSGETRIDQGRLIMRNASALGSGLVTNNAQLELALTADGSVANQLAGSGSLIKSGAGAVTLTHANSTAGAVNVNNGQLSFGQAGAFRAASLTTAAGAATDLGGEASLLIGGAFTQTAGSTLSLSLGNLTPIIRAGSANLAGALNIDGFASNLARASAITLDRRVIIQSTQVINSDFDSVTFGGQNSGWDFLLLDGHVDGGLGVGTTYSVGLKLAWLSDDPAQAHGTFTLPEAADSFEVDVVLGDRPAADNWDGVDLTKAGLGNLILSGANTYSGLTHIQAGTLTAGAQNVFAQSSQLIVDSGAKLALNSFDQTALGLSGSGAIDLGTARLTLNNSSAASFSGLIEGSGGLTKTGAGVLTLSGDNTYSGDTIISGGRLIAQSGTAMGRSRVTNNSVLELALAADGLIANTLTGTGQLLKTGGSTATLTGAGSQAGAVTVSGGTLSFAQSGAFQAASLTTDSGATTDFRPDSLLALTGALTQADGSSLKIGLPGANVPVIQADSVNLGGGLLIDGFSPSLARASVITANRRVIIKSDQLINGDFSSVSFGGQSSGLDFLILDGHKDTGPDHTYSVGFALAWNSSIDAEARGTFTLPEDSIFNVDLPLIDKPGSTANSWDGKTLTKLGAGILVLSSANTYSGNTAIKAGTLVTGALNTLASSAEVMVDDGAKLDLGGYNQTVKNISGLGTIDLGTARLTVDSTSARTFGGLIEGAGGLTKDGTGSLTLSGDNTYEGETIINGGRLIAQSGSALGKGPVTNSSELELALSSDGTLGNVLSGTGNLIKSGGFTTTLTGLGSSAGAVSVDDGTLALAQAGAFTAASYLTKAGAGTTIGADSQLAVNGAFTQEADSALTVQAGQSNSPAITAGSSNIGGDLVISGLSLTAPSKASDLDQASFTVIQSTNAIVGDFDQVTLNTRAGGVDYLVAGGRKTDSDRRYVAGLSLAWEAGPSLAHGTFTIDESQSFEVDVPLGNQGAAANWNGHDLTKAGLGNLILSRVNTYDGLTDIQGGTLTMGIEDAIAASSDVKVEAGAVLDLNNFNQTLNNLTGAGTINLRAADLTAANNVTGTGFSGQIIGDGGLTKTGGQSLTLSGVNSYSGGTTIADGRLIAQSGTALGQGAVVNNSELELALTADGTVANQLTGGGQLIKSGGFEATLTGENSSVGAVQVQAGALTLAQNGLFTADSYVTGGGASTNIGANSQLVVNGAFQQSADSTLTAYVGSGNSPAIRADSADINGDLNISGLLNGDHPAKASDLVDQQFAVIQSNTAIQGDFATVDFGSVASPADYLVAGGWKINNDTTYVVGLGLAWEAGPSQANGLFTLPGANDSFEVDVVLANQTGSPVTRWDGRSLTKAGLGNLILSQVNTYDGKTDIQAGALTTGIENAIAASSAVNVEAGATLHLNNFNQTARNLTGAGAIKLGAADLTVANDLSGGTVFSGRISGSGGLIKTGGQSLTLSGDNSYAGGTTIDDGRLIAQSGTAMGQGTVVNNSELELALTADGTVANQLTGGGQLIKSGNAEVTLTGENSSVGATEVQFGALTLAQNGIFTADSFGTASGATTNIGAESQLAVNGAFSQSAGSTLTVYVGQDNDPAVRTGSADIGGDLNISGLMNTDHPAKASDLEGQQYTVIESGTAITGDFARVNFGSAVSPADYLVADGRKINADTTYVVGLGLAWEAGPSQAHGSFTLPGANDSFEVDVVLANQAGSPVKNWNGRDLTKAGLGNLILSRVNTYTGLTDIQAGTLTTGIENAIAASGQVVVAAGAKLDLNDYNQIAQNLSGEGGIDLGTADLTVLSSEDSSFTGSIEGQGRLIKEGDAKFTLSGRSSYSGGTLINDGRLVVRNSGVLGDLRAEPLALRPVYNNTALGTGQVENNSALELNFITDGQVANLLTGGGLLEKTGGASAILTAAGSSAGQVRVLEGDLTIGQGVDFAADDFSIAAQTSLTMLDGSRLDTGTMNFDANSTFAVELGQTDPLINAGSVTLAGLLNVELQNRTRASDIDPDSRHTIVRTDELITTDFSAVNFAGRSAQVDYLLLNGHVDEGQRSYSLGLELAWYAGPANAHGTFTLANADDVFEVDVVLEDRDIPAVSRWTGRDLTKNGAGTLILSQANTYTGTTTVNGGLLSLTSDSALGRTSLLSLADGAGVALNGTSQTVGLLNTASGSRLDFGGGLLTINQNQREPEDQSDSAIAGGTLFGSGGLLLNPAVATVTGANEGYTGDVTVAGGSTLILNDAAGVGLRGLINLDQAEDSLVFDLASSDQAGFSKSLAGIGLVDLKSGTDLKLTGDNQGFSGLFQVETGSTLTASEADHLGWSKIDLAGTLNLAPESNWRMMNTVTGQGRLVKTGAGQLLIHNNFSDFTGTAQIEQGALIVGDFDQPDSTLGATTVGISSGGILSGVGRVAGTVNNQGAIQALNALPGYETAPVSNLTIGALTNSGDILLNGSSLGNTLTVVGGLTSNGGRLVLNTYLAGDDSPTDRLILDGGRATGTTELVVINQGGPGAATERGILLVDAINGATTATDAFALSAASNRFRAGLGSLTVGAYDYSLLRGGVGGQAESWYLVSGLQRGLPVARPESGIYLAGREAAEGMFRQNLYDRLMSYQTLVDAEGRQVPSGAWVKMEGGRTRSQASHNLLRTETDTLIINTGLDLARWSSPDYGSFTTGLMFGLGRAKHETKSRVDQRFKATGDTDGYSVGLYGYWFQNQDRRDGFYADAWLRRSWFDHTSKGRGLAEESYGSRLWSASLEGGYSAQFYQSEKASWSFDPSVQAIFHRFSGGSFTERGGTRISSADDSSWDLRLGGRLHGRVETEGGLGLSPYLEANWRHYTGDNRVVMDLDSVYSNRPDNTAEIKLGLAADWTDGLSATIGVVTEFGSGDYRQVGGQAGFRYEW